MSPQVRRLLLDFGPVLLFWLVLLMAGIYWATGTIMVAVTASLSYGYWKERRLAFMPLITAALVLTLGGLTLYLKDTTYFKMKPTAAYIFFALLLFVGLPFRRLFLKDMLSLTLPLDDYAWKVLTWRWAFFFLFLAGLNEVVWRNFSDTVWGTFKLGCIALFFLFSLSQMPFILAHEKKDSPPQE